jgi:hypothetical protein
MIRDLGFHGWRHPQRPVNPAERMWGSTIRLPTKAEKPGLSMERIKAILRLGWVLWQSSLVFLGQTGYF